MSILVFRRILCHCSSIHLALVDAVWILCHSLQFNWLKQCKEPILLKGFMIWFQHRMVKIYLILTKFCLLLFKVPKTISEMRSHLQKELMDVIRRASQQFIDMYVKIALRILFKFVGKKNFSLTSSLNIRVLFLFDANSIRAVKLSTGKLRFPVNKIVSNIFWTGCKKAPKIL